MVGFLVFFVIIFLYFLRQRITIIIAKIQLQENIKKQVVFDFGLSELVIKERNLIKMWSCRGPKANRPEKLII